VRGIFSTEELKANEKRHKGTEYDYSIPAVRGKRGKMGKKPGR